MNSVVAEMMLWSAAAEVVVLCDAQEAEMETETGTETGVLLVVVGKLSARERTIYVESPTTRL